MKLTQESANPSKLRANLTIQMPAGVRILMVCEPGPNAEQLKTVLQGEGLALKAAESMAEGCELARSGTFPVVLSQPLLSDGPWTHLIGVAKQYGLEFEVVLLARTFDLMQWADALKQGAFDVLDVLHELPKAVEAVKRAFWAAHLKGAAPPREVGKRARAA